LSAWELGSFALRILALGSPLIPPCFFGPPVQPGSKVKLDKRRAQDRGSFMAS
jgi:hypothetical protein